MVFDDSKDRRESLELLLSMQADMKCVGTYSDGEFAEEMTQFHQPDVILMDIQMPRVNGIVSVAKIKSVFPHVAILMQTVFEDEERIFASIKAGASGYLLKNASPDRIIEAVREAHEGGAPMSPSIAMRVLRYFREEAEVATPDYALTDREKEILNALVSGLSYKMIAADVGISYHTVNSHIKRIYEKLHVNSASEAVSKAIREKLV